MLVEKEEELCIATRNVNALVRLSTISYGLFSLTTNKKNNVDCPKVYGEIE